MPLTKAQILVLQNASVRQRLPTKASDFNYVDQLLKDVGPGCPRLPAVWERIFHGLSSDNAKWLNTTFPGFNFVGSSTSNTPLPPVPSSRNSVTRAIDVLQSYKKSP